MVETPDNENEGETQLIEEEALEFEEGQEADPVTIDNENEGETRLIEEEAPELEEGQEADPVKIEDPDNEKEGETKALELEEGEEAPDSDIEAEERSSETDEETWRTCYIAGAGWNRMVIKKIRPFDPRMYP